MYSRNGEKCRSRNVVVEISSTPTYRITTSLEKGAKLNTEWMIHTNAVYVCKLNMCTKQNTLNPLTTFFFFIRKPTLKSSNKKSRLRKFYKLLISARAFYHSETYFILKENASPFYSCFILGRIFSPLLQGLSLPRRSPFISCQYKFISWTDVNF